MQVQSLFGFIDFQSEGDVESDYFLYSLIVQIIEQSSINWRLLFKSLSYPWLLVDELVKAYVAESVSQDRFPLDAKAFFNQKQIIGPSSFVRHCEKNNCNWLWLQWELGRNWPFEELICSWNWQVSRELQLKNLQLQLAASLPWWSTSEWTRHLLYWGINSFGWTS